MNYAQVEEQTGFLWAKGGDGYWVAGNTHLAGSVIDSEAAEDKNHFKTNRSLTLILENRGEVGEKRECGVSTDMAQNTKNAMAAAKSSALGNKHEKVLQVKRNQR